MANARPLDTPLQARHAVRRLLEALLGFEAVRGAALVGALPAADQELAHQPAILVLLAAAEQTDLRPAQIGSLTGLSSGGVTGLVERMEAAGLLERVLGQVQGDRRGVLIVLTPRGRELAAMAAGALLAPSRDLDAALAELGESVAAYRTARVAPPGA